MPAFAALGFVQQFNTVQVVYQNDHGNYGDLTEVAQIILTHKPHFKPGSGGYLWITQFTPFGEEVFPGWKLDYALRPDKQSYRLILRGELYTIITDEEHIIYRAKTPATVPTAHDLKDAASFPGAVPHDLFKEDQPVGWDRIRNWFTPTVVRAQNCCQPTPQNTCQCSCSTCVVLCCGLTCYNIRPPSGCFLAAGCSDCKYMQSSCGSGCFACSQNFFSSACCLGLNCSRYACNGGV